MKASLKTRLVFVTIILFISMSFIPMTSGISQERQALVDDQVLDYSVTNIEGKPDFVIDDIFLWPSDFPNEYHFEYRLKNIGDTPIYNFGIKTNIQIRWMIFGKIPLFTIYSNYIYGNIGALLPGDSINIGFISCDSLPKFGSYRISLTINPGKTIDESNFDNNKYSEDWKVFLWDWKEIG